MSNIKKSALEYFQSKPTAKEVHATTDGFLFELKQDANAHSRTLEDQEVQTISNSANDESLDDENPLRDLTVEKLKAKAVELELPEAEWKSLKKDDLVKYLTEKTTLQE